MPELSPSQQSDTQVKGSHALLMSKMLSPKDRLAISWSPAVEIKVKALNPRRII